MEAENSANALIFSRVESKYYSIIVYIQFYILKCLVIYPKIA